MNIVYLSKNMGGYQSASYQQDVMDELSKQANVFFYGPGFSGYDIDDSIDDVLAKSASDPDVIILGHAWLSDLDGGTVDPHPRLNLSQTNILKVVKVDKEIAAGSTGGMVEAVRYMDSSVD